MNKNEAKRKLLRLFVSVIFYLIGAFSVQTGAEDAFVVEEEVIIGGEEGTAVVAPPVTEPAQRPEVSKEPAEKKETAPKKSKTGKKTEQETESSGESNQVSVSENVVSENAVSQNSVSLPFRTPVRKQATKLEENVVNKEEKIKLREEMLPEESKPEEMPKQTAPWSFFVMGVVFFLCGCIRVVRKVGNRKKSL